jgi:outer membrane protein OmpA-like peptidoglycan-associated protein
VLLTPLLRPRFLPRFARAVPFTALLALSASASAQEIGLRLEPGVALPLSTPQTDRFGVGGTASVKAYLGLSRFFQLQAGKQVIALPTEEGTVPDTTGTAWSDSLGLRLQRPHDGSPGGSRFSAAAPWIDADAYYVRTGSLNRLGLSAGVGLSFPLGERRVAWLGPFVRYMQIVQPETAGFDSSDGRFLLVGLALDLGRSPLPKPHRDSRPEAAPAPPCPTCPPVTVLPSDRDGDGLADDRDNCPDVAGPNQGCPVYKKVIVKPDKLELSEKIFFAFDRADIEAESFPLLDEVVLALKDNKGFRVQVEGHSDSTGGQGHNQTLSEQRAEAVLAYLRNHGVASDRLSFKGFGESTPTDTNTTVAGRENNRRVEFVVQFKIIDRSAK